MKNAMVATLLSVLLGCTTNGNEPEGATRAATTPLEGTTWVLTELYGQPVSFAKGKKPITLRLNPNTHQADVFGGVNNFSGDYRLEGDRIVFGLMMGTLIGGSPEATRIEDGMRKVVSGSVSVSLNGDELALKSADGTVARFKKAA